MIGALIGEDWSHEQISGWMKLEMNIYVSPVCVRLRTGRHEWIYHHILLDKQSGGHLYRHLRCRKKRKKRYGSNDRRGRD